MLFFPFLPPAVRLRGKLDFEFSKFKYHINQFYSVHRCFSAVGLYITKLRTRLSSGMIEDLFILRGHFAEVEEERKKRRYTKKDLNYWKKV